MRGRDAAAMGKGAGKGRGMSVGEFCGDMADSARNPTGRMFWCFWLVAGAIFTIVTLSMTIEAIDSTELGLPYDTVKCNLKREVKGEGMHFKTVYGEFIKWPAMYKRLSLEEQCNSKDGLQITIGFTFQYIPNPTSLYDLTNLYMDYAGYVKNLKLRAKSAMRNTCAKYTAQEFQTLRAAVQITMYEDIIAAVDTPVLSDEMRVDDIAKMPVGTSGLDTQVKSRRS